jgi:hypothetical protein
MVWSSTKTHRSMAAGAPGSGSTGKDVWGNKGGSIQTILGAPQGPNNWKIKTASQVQNRKSTKRLYSLLTYRKTVGS